MELMSAAARTTDDPDPLVRADAHASLCDARAAACLANGVAVEDIDPATGYNISATAYETARESWREYVRSHGLDEWYMRPRFERAYGFWAAHRPDLAAGDDWLAGLVKPEDNDPQGV